MIASEGLKSPAVIQMLNLSHDLAARYAEGENDAQGHVKKRYYQGQKYMSQIEDYATDHNQRTLSRTTGQTYD
jgi:glycine/serine hydroxymethyltransferase